MTLLESLLAGLGVFGTLAGWRLGRYVGRREGMLHVNRALVAVAALRRSRIAQDVAEHVDVFRDSPGLSEAERDAWAARELS